MKFARAPLLLAIVSLFVDTCMARVVDARVPRRNQRWRNRNRNRNRGRFPRPPIFPPRGQQQQKTPSQNTFIDHPIDPADISTIIGGSQWGSNLDMKNFLGSMFQSELEIDALVADTRAEIDPTKRAGLRKRPSHVVSTRVSKTIGTVGESQTGTLRAASNAENCCQTTMSVSAPGTVMLDGRTMSVVHLNHSYQFIQEGSCVDPGASCRSIGVCTQMYKYAFMLLYDPDLVGKVSPPVTYGRVPIKSHCECMNIGRVQ